MDTAPAGNPENLTIHWPEPAHLRLDTKNGAPEPCELQFVEGPVEVGELVRFTGRDDHLVFRPHPGHPRYPSKIVVRTNRLKRLKLTDPVQVYPIDASVLGASVEPIDPQQMHVYNVEFTDHEIESGDTSGFVRSPIGLFLYFSRPGNRVERVFVPETAIAYFQAGEPIGRLLVEENAVSEEQLAAAVEKQQEMRKLVLGDYLIEEGLITPHQLDEALAHQRTKPSLRLGEALIEMGAVQPEALQIALARQRANRSRPLGQILVDMGVVDSDTLNKIHAKKSGRHFVSLANFAPSDEAIRAVPAKTAKRLGIVPLSIEQGDLIIASESQLDPSAISELTLHTRMRVVQVLAPGKEIQDRRHEAYGEALADDKLTDASAIRFESMEVIEAGTPAEEGDESVFRESTVGLSDPHLIMAIERALKAVGAGGSLDIHVETRGSERTTRIRLSR
jgi:Type II secretion system (T2SS), protein E, N-terminal domain